MDAQQQHDMEMEMEMEMSPHKPTQAKVTALLAESEANSSSEASTQEGDLVQVVMEKHGLSEERAMQVLTDLGA